MRLFYFPTSPFVRKVMVVLHETGQLGDVEVAQTKVAPTADTSEYSDHNPLGKIPALERSDGPTLYDSRVICAYLDARADAGLYGTGETRWENLALEATADGIMEAAVLMVYEHRLRPENFCWPQWTEAQWEKVARAISSLNRKWMARLAEPLNMGQISVACALAYVDFRHADRDWRNDNPDLAAWFAEFETRPGMIATRPPAG